LPGSEAGGCADGRQGELRLNRAAQSAAFLRSFVLGLYYEARATKNWRCKHITEAAEEYKVDDYMGDVARVHADLLKKK